DRRSGDVMNARLRSWVRALVGGCGIAALAFAGMPANVAAVADDGPEIRDLTAHYALAVAGSVLTAGSAGSATISQAQLAAIKANGAKYHFEYLELNPGVPAEAAAIASLQAELMVPATAETAVVAGTASNPVGAVLLG